MTDDQLEDLEALRGWFNGGIDDETVADASAYCHRALGFDLVVVWDFEDMWGFGGNSEILALKDNQLRDLPDGVWEFIWDGEGDAASLFDRSLGIRQRKPPYRDNACNWSYRKNINKELD